ncbi:hypothetical protein [Pontibacter cellulosilyticus]|uniref:Uncharacterized protein n=1 Tax=Pontibacter cellulosilyticus TaxID=1720253 RepID=A0A923NCG8_9BACT|nr:hypothetical protein [Pontibacter cellulosilyticus]MBC5994862.1 hypothetical protein [Pontibacter cellulosilyticus]
MRDNRVQAALEELGYELEGSLASKLFHNIKLYMLYNDRDSFMSMLNYRSNLEPLERIKEDYFLFKFMLKQMKSKSPAKLLGFISDRKFVD